MNPDTSDNDQPLPESQPSIPVTPNEDTSLSASSSQETAPNDMSSLTQAHESAVVIPEPTLDFGPSASASSDKIPPAPMKAGHRIMPRVLGLIIIVALLVGAFALGKHSSSTTMKPTQMSSDAMTASEIPDGATLIEQCEPGLGTQYVLPKDIPNGPIYNVYKGKLTGIEYMINLSALQATNSEVSNLKLNGHGYDHINIMSMPAHAGFPEPHYEIDVMMVPSTVTNTITCGTGSAQPSMSSMSM